MIFISHFWGVGEVTPYMRETVLCPMEIVNHIMWLCALYYFLVNTSYIYVFSEDSALLQTHSSHLHQWGPQTPWQNYPRYLNSSIVTSSEKLWITSLIQPYTKASRVQPQCATKTVTASRMILWCHSHLLIGSEGSIHALVFIQNTLMWLYWIALVYQTTLFALIYYY